MNKDPGVGSSGRQPYRGLTHQSHCSCRYELERARKVIAAAEEWADAAWASEEDGEDERSLNAGSALYKAVTENREAKRS